MVAASFHMFHMVTMSPWPVVVGVGILFVVLGFIKMLVLGGAMLFVKAIMGISVMVMLWWRDIIRESTYQGEHSSGVLKGLMVGMILFIVSEVFFFLSFFWTFFYSSLVPVVELGGIWPPMGVVSFNPFCVPLLNTVILLSSGVSVTWAHQGMMGEEWSNVKNSLGVTWGLGAYFLMLQGVEYYSAFFDISDSVFGSVFFMATGFHGFHVMVGSIFLFVIWVRCFLGHFSSSHHFGFEAAAWYWHFVDVVWLFLFSVVYWWGG